MNDIQRAYYHWRNKRKFTKIGKNCRIFCKDLDVQGNVEIGDYIHMRDHIKLRTRHKGKIVLKDRSHLSWNVIVECGEYVEIGENAALSEYVIVRDGTHLIYGTKEHWRFTPHIMKPVIIGKDAWIGSRAYINYGVTIGEGAVVGVGAVVTKDIGDYEIWAGTPAKFISHRVDNVPPHKLAEAKELLERFGVRPDRRMEDE